MMLSLPLDIPLDVADPFLAHRESGVAFLPPEISYSNIFTYPFGRSLFGFTHEIGDGHCRGESHKQVNVILNTAYYQGDRTKASNGSA